jgi:glucose/arabinose dehydrogenase
MSLALRGCARLVGIGLAMMLIVACGDGSDDAAPTSTGGSAASAVDPTITTAASTSAAGDTTEVMVAGQTITLPAGLTISVFAEDLGRARFMALDEDGVLFVTDPSGDRVLKLPDDDEDGVADDVITVVSGLTNPHGIAFHDGAMYLGEETRVSRVVDANSDGVYERPVPIIDGLPTDGHWSRTVVFGPDGQLYLAVGSSCNVCNEDQDIRAAISRYAPDGSAGEIVASGLRNAVGLAFNPETGELWATNNGRDGLGDNVPPETVNRIVEGADFGWPRCHAGDIVDPDFGGERGCDGVEPPAVTMQAHSAPLGLTFYTGDALDSDYTGDLFVAFHGSWDRAEPTGYKVVQLPFVNGQPTGEVLDFAIGWLGADGEAWGRPVDVLAAPDGSLFVSDDEGGRIFRISSAT